MVIAGSMITNTANIAAQVKTESCEVRRYPMTAISANVGRMDVINGDWISARLPDKRDSRGERARLARHMDWDSAKLSKVLNGTRKVQAEEIPKLLSFFGLGEDASAVADRQDGDERTYALIPVYDVEASAGPGLVAPETEAVAYRLELPADYIASLTDSHPRHLQVISVKGVSMLPTLKPGDLVMIDRAKTSLTYDGLFVLDIDGAILVKRIGRSPRPGFVTVISDNDREQPSFERAMKHIKVLGKVIWAGVKQ